MKKFVFSVVVLLGVIGLVNVFHQRMEKAQPAFPKHMPLAEYYREYISFYEKHLKRDPFSATAVKNIAAAKLSLARATGNEALYQEAEDLLRASEKFMPKGDTSYPLLLSRTMMARHRFQAARELLDQALESNPDLITLRQSRADALQGYGDYDAALKEIEWVRGREKSFSAEVRLAQLLDVVGRDDEALEHLRGAIARFRVEDPEASAWIRLMLGIYFLKRGDLPAAKSYFEESLKKAPDYYLAKEHLAEIFETEGNFAAAKPLLEGAIETKRDPNLLSRLSKVERELGNIAAADALHAEALRMLEENAKRDPAAHGRDFAEALLDEGGDAKLALSYLEQEYAARPGDILSNLARARCLRILQRPEEAKKYLDQAMRYPNADADVYVEAAALMRSLGDSAKATEYERQAKQKDPYSVL